MDLCPHGHRSPAEGKPVHPISDLWRQDHVGTAPHRHNHEAKGRHLKACLREIDERLSAEGGHYHSTAQSEPGPGSKDTADHDEAAPATALRGERLVHCLDHSSWSAFCTSPSSSVPLDCGLGPLRPAAPQDTSSPAGAGTNSPSPYDPKLVWLQAGVSGHRLCPGGLSYKDSPSRPHLPSFPVSNAPDKVREALVRQWSLIADAVPALDPGAQSRVSGWLNREVIAHLAMQPSLLARFLKTASVAQPEVSLEENLAGTVTLSEMINTAAREAAEADLDFAARMTRVLPALSAANLNDTVTTMQGPISLLDYLRTRCVEAVVHGCDLAPPVSPDEEALQIAATALLGALEARRGDLMPAARSLPALVWVDQATGRAQSGPPLDEALPVMS